MSMKIGNFEAPQVLSSYFLNYLSELYSEKINLDGAVENSVTKFCPEIIPIISFNFFFEYLICDQRGKIFIMIYH